MPKEDKYLEKAQAFASELGLQWERVVDIAREEYKMLSIVLEWLYKYRGQLGFKKFRQDITCLAEYGAKKKLQPFLNMGYTLPDEITESCFFDFWITLREILTLFPKPADFRP